MTYTKNIFILWANLALLFALSGCSFKEYNNSQAKLITIKTPTLKFSDIGYFRSDETSVQVELYTSGIAVQKFEIERYVCTNDGCLSKNAFNEDYLSGYYPDELLKNVLLKKPIYSGRNLEKNDNGYSQHIVDEDVNITYKVLKDSMRFQDSKNHILIKFKKMKP